MDIPTDSSEEGSPLLQYLTAVRLGAEVPGTSLFLFFILGTDLFLGTPDGLPSVEALTTAAEEKKADLKNRVREVSKVNTHVSLNALTTH